MSELLGVVGFQDLTKKELLSRGGGGDYLVGSGFEGFGSDGCSEFLVWDTPSIVTMDDLIASNSSEHSFQAMGVPPLPKVLFFFLNSCQISWYPSWVFCGFSFTICSLCS